MKPCRICKKREKIAKKSYCRECFNKKQRDFRRNKRKIAKTTSQTGYNWYWNLWCD